jgi:hypothetical protein
MSGRLRGAEKAAVGESRLGGRGRERGSGVRRRVGAIAMKQRFWASGVAMVSGFATCDPYVLTPMSLWEDHYGNEVGQNKGGMTSRKSKMENGALGSGVHRRAGEWSAATTERYQPAENRPGNRPGASRPKIATERYQPARWPPKLVAHPGAPGGRAGPIRPAF